MPGKMTGICQECNEVVSIKVPDILSKIGEEAILSLSFCNDAILIAQHSSIANQKYCPGSGKNPLQHHIII